MSDNEIDKIERLESEQEEALEEALGAARTHQRAGRLRETASIFNKILDLDPENIEALSGIAEISAISNQPLSALPIYSKILKNDPSNLNALSNRGVLLMHIGDAEASEFSFRKVLKFYPEDIDGLNNLGTCLIEQNKFEDAKQYLTKATELAPEKATSFYNLGVLYIKSTPRDFPKQLEYLEKALELDPSYVEATMNVANIYGQLGDLEKSLRFLDKALLDKPDHPLILFNKGLALRALKRFDDAIDCLKVVRPIFDQPHLVDYEIGNTHYEAGSLKESIAFYISSISERKNFSNGLIALGKSFAESGQLAKAKDAFQRAGTGKNGKQLISAIDILTRDQDPWKLASEIYDAEKLGICSPTYTWKGEPSDKALIIHTIGISEGEIVLLSRLFEDLSKSVPEIKIVTPTSFQKLLPCFHLPISFIPNTELNDSMFNDETRHIHLNAIPSLLNLEEGSLPYNGPYMVPDDKRERLWDPSIFEGNELKIGLCWHANDKRSGPNQQLRFEEFEPLIELEGAHFLNLIPTKSKTQKGNLRDFNVTDLGEKLRDHEDLLAVIDKLDLLITADILPAYLAGALNKRSIVLLPLFPNWQWGYKTNETPYYPNTTLMRQSISNDWDRPVQRTRDLLIAEFGLN